MYSHIQLTAEGQFLCKIPAGEIIEWDAENYCTAFALEKDGKAEQFNIRPYYTAAEPAHDPLTQSVQEVEPAPVDGFWTQQWVVVDLGPDQVAANFAALKAAKNDEINAARLAANFTTFQHAGKAIACDQLSRSDIDGTNGFVALYGALPPGWPGGWKAADNTYVAIATVADWKAFYSSMFAAGNANFAKAQALKGLLAAANTAAAVAAIRWDMVLP